MCSSQAIFSSINSFSDPDQDTNINSKSGAEEANGPLKIITSSALHSMFQELYGDWQSLYRIIGYYK